jgi:hypothetical protein
MAAQERFLMGCPVPICTTCRLTARLIKECGYFAYLECPGPVRKEPGRVRKEIDSFFRQARVSARARSRRKDHPGEVGRRENKPTRASVTAI